MSTNNQQLEKMIKKTTIAEMKQRALTLLTQYYGHTNFRPHQLELIIQIILKKDALAMIPTAGGKSLTFQLPPLMLKKTAIIVSPLISLMNDQVLQLTSYGIKAIAINGEVNDPMIRASAWRGEYSLIYCAPETLLMCLDGVEQLYQNKKLCLIGVDEAHVVSELGHDFRPKYRCLNVLRERFPTVPILAVTATATDDVSKDIVNQLKLRNPLIVRSTVNRPNIELRVKIRTGEKLQECLPNTLFGTDQAIVFCLTKKDVQKVHEHLSNTLQLKSACYHSGLEKDEKSSVHKQFLLGEIQVVVATIAYAMGVDVGNVRTIVNFGLPKSMQTFVQQCGRAGRDGSMAVAWLIWSNADLLTNQRFLTHAKTEAEAIPIDGIDELGNSFQTIRVAALHNVNKQKELLESMKQYANSDRCRRQVLLEYFGEIHPGNCSSCDNCSEEAQSRVKHDITDHARWFAKAVQETKARFGSGLLIDLLRGTGLKVVMQKLKVKDVVELESQYTCFRKLNCLSEKQVKQLYQTLLTVHVVKEVQPSWSSKFPFSLVMLDHIGQSLVVRDDFRLDNVVASYLETQTSSKQGKPATKRYSFGTDGEEEVQEIPLDIKENMLMQRLINWRNEEAKSRNLAPFMILNNTSLECLARKRPVRLSDFRSISGFGEFKANLYGPVLSPMIESICQELQIQITHEDTKRIKTSV